MWPQMWLHLSNYVPNYDGVKILVLIKKINKLRVNVTKILFKGQSGNESILEGSKV